MAVVIWSVLDTVDLLFLSKSKDFKLFDLSIDKVKDHYTSLSLTFMLKSTNNNKSRYVKDALRLTKST